MHVLLDAARDTHTSKGNCRYNAYDITHAHYCLCLACRSGVADCVEAAVDDVAVAMDGDDDVAVGGVVAVADRVVAHSPEMVAVRVDGVLT